MKIKFIPLFLLFGFSVLIFSCTKDKEVLTAKDNQEEAEMKIAAAFPRVLIKKVQVQLRGSQMVPAVQTKTLGSMVLQLWDNKVGNYKLTLFNLPPGEFATAAILYEGEPGENGTPVAFLPFGPTDNGIKKSLLFTDDQYNTLTYLLSPPILPLLPNSYFVITTNLHPAGLLRGAVQL